MAQALEREIGNANLGVAPSAYNDLDKRVPKHAWPNSIRVYDEMRHDPQIAALLLALTLPIMRYRCFVDPNGASDEAVEHVAGDLRLPVKGADPGPKPRTRDRFDHGLHLVKRCSTSCTGRCSSSRSTATTRPARSCTSASWPLACQAASPRSPLLPTAAWTSSASTPRVTTDCRTGRSR